MFCLTLVTKDNVIWANEFVTGVILGIIALIGMILNTTSDLDDDGSGGGRKNDDGSDGGYSKKEYSQEILVKYQ